MKVVLCGAFGNLGREILKRLIAQGHEVVAADMAEKDVDGVEKGKGYTFRKINVLEADSLKGMCEGADLVITTVGLVTSSKTITNYDVDYKGNLAIMNDALACGVKKFIYISVLKADSPKWKKVAMCDAKAMMEKDLKASGMEYIILRPTGYFYDIAKVFKPMVEKGKVSLLDLKNQANVIDTSDMAQWIIENMEKVTNETVSIGGKEIYTFEEIAQMCFDAAGKPAVIKKAPAFLFDILAFMAKIRKTGKEAVIRFGKFTMVENMVADVKYGEKSFKEYIGEYFK